MAAGRVGDGNLRCAGKEAVGPEVGVLLCDVDDAASLAAMARQTRLVLNCVGPVSAAMRDRAWGRPSATCFWAPRSSGQATVQ